MIETDIKVFPVGHEFYPEGRVIVTENGVTTEYTLAQWHALQQ